ncbi:conserved Plasmodium protein, unknown function [Plasmodium gallinaceum]|uniref:Uncharacterized protein n=1 Tax=Plasmodium gallinaceum TaxID=5849 RepID=A0A1J1H011_PLAGA|nr:conserved Plasmodium protein, unknown function [Plasmodium gallinaceum]CRG98073.1 conserved Plasmodium protein, unknown function [Plasmodium gallinaceum]
MKVNNFKNKKLKEKQLTENLKPKKTKKLKNELTLRNNEKYKQKKDKVKYKKKSLNLSKHDDTSYNVRKEEKIKKDKINSVKTITSKKINKKEEKESSKLRIYTDISESEDLDEELCDDDNLFMPSKSKYNKRKSLINETSKQKKKKNLKKKQCAAKYLKLNEYNEEYEKELLSYAINGFYKYVNFLKNYKNSITVENQMDNKKPKHLYV